MLVKSITEKEIYDIGHAFGYYDYGQETGMSAAFSGKDATANYICAYVRGVLRSGFLHTTSERGEGYIAYKHSIVFRDVTLFDNTILENIRLGRKGATDKEVLAAAKLANCEEFAEKLPDKWNTTIGENGCALSGGERQRISIARVFLKDAPIILLDEATASLDVENETAIQEALSRLIKDKTVLIIAHRMRTVSSADKIVVLKDGTVAEQGSPAQLLHDGGIFDHMVQLQTKSQGWSLTKA
jgi:ATP-binding cassette subfamily B protein